MLFLVAIILVYGHRRKIAVGVTGSAERATVCDPPYRSRQEIWFDK